MSGLGKWTGIAGLIAVVAAASMAASCARYGLVQTEEYIGPPRAVTPAPAAPGEKLAPAKPGEKPAPAKPGEKPAAAPSVEAPKPPEGEIPPTGAIPISVTQAMLLALGNNQSLAVQRYNVPIFRTFVEDQRALFDPILAASIQRQRSLVLSPGGRGNFATMGTINTLEAGISEFFPTGTQVAVTGSTDIAHGSANPENFYATRYGLSVTQSLLRGFGLDVNLASLRQARVDVLTSEYELRGFAESLVAQVEEAYWDYTLAQRNIEIFTQSLQLAQQQLRETEERIRVGKLADIERAAAEAEVALRRENLINANSALATARLSLLRLINPAKSDFWSRDVTILTPPGPPKETLEDVASHVKVAMRMRPDLNQARTLVQRDDLEIVKTKNGLLPRMDLFVTLGKTGYASSFGGSYGNLHERGYDLLVGMSMEYPVLNRSARAVNQRAHLTRQQAVESVGNVAQLVEVDVRSAYIEVERAKEQVAATAVTRRLQEETVRAETEKFRVGKSTTLLVAQAHRDLLQSQISEVVAVVAHLKALVAFYQLEGSLLERRGIVCPGREPAEMPPPRLP
ncbi:MAG: TolC family protein [Planctomycetota bacterium]|nr:TolC family protein [Planctomycetota bacterium]